MGNTLLYFLTLSILLSAAVCLHAASLPQLIGKYNVVIPIESFYPRSLDFRFGQISFRGCNKFAGKYTVDQDGNFHTDGWAATTQNQCSDQYDWAMVYFLERAASMKQRSKYIFEINDDQDNLLVRLMKI